MDQMSYVDFLTLAISLVSVVLSLISMYRTQQLAKEQMKLAEEQIELERVTAELSKKQIKQIENDDQQRHRPNLHVILNRVGRNYYFLVTNLGDGSAYGLNFELVDCNESPIVDGELGRFPLKELKSQGSVKIRASIHLGSPLSYNVRLSWKERDDSAKVENFHLDL